MLFKPTVRRCMGDSGGAWVNLDKEVIPESTIDKATGKYRNFLLGDMAVD